MLLGTAGLTLTSDTDIDSPACPAAGMRYPELYRSDGVWQHVQPLSHLL